MKIQIIVRSVVLAALLSPGVALGFETNQYDLPPKPLADIGSEVTAHVKLKLQTAVDKVNAEIASSERCIAARAGERGMHGCGNPDNEKIRLAYLRSEDAIAREAFAQLGDGFPPFTSMGTWMDSHHFLAQPARYRTSLWKSIFILNPGVALTISPTVNLYGSEFGTDKIAHVFQQGYTYYKIYRQALAEGATPVEATDKAVRWGQKSERTFYGTLVAGVYSNGDLCANYVGLKFYQGLTKPITIGSAIRAPVLEIHNGLWMVSVDTKELLLKPLISDHLNEAMNPSIFTSNLGWRWYIRRSVKKRSCAQWRASANRVAGEAKGKTSAAVARPPARCAPIPSRRKIFDRGPGAVAAGSVVSRYSACIVAAHGTGARLRPCCGGMTIL